MGNIIVALPKTEDGKKIRNILQKHDLQVSAVCNLGVVVLQEIERMPDGGVVICGSRLGDMHYTELLECLPPYCEMLLIGSAHTLAENEHKEIMALETPLKVFELVNTVTMILTNQERKRKKKKEKPKPRNRTDDAQIQKAKYLLMGRNRLSESEAYRYIQKSSMDTGTNMVETAQMILMLLYDEV